MSAVRYVLDTSVCISLIRGRATINALPPVKECAVSVITAAELEVGIQRSTRPAEQLAAVGGLLTRFRSVSFEMSAVRHYGEIRVSLERRGTPIGPLDLLIAAHARNLNAAVVTGNVGEFRRVDGLLVIPWNDSLVQPP